MRKLQLEDANFAQRDYSEAFSKKGNFAGRTIDDVADALRKGDLKPSDVSIDYIIREGRHMLILDTRSAQALERADIPRSMWHVVDRTGIAEYEKRLDKQLRGNKLGNEGIRTVRSRRGG